MQTWGNPYVLLRLPNRQNDLLNTVALHQFFINRAVAAAKAFVFHYILKLHNAIKYSFRPRRATGYIDINRNNLVDALQHRIRVENTTTGGAGANSDYPTRFCHLQINLPQNRTHFLGNCARNQQHIALARCKAHTL